MFKLQSTMDSLLNAAYGDSMQGSDMPKPAAAPVTGPPGSGSVAPTPVPVPAKPGNKMEDKPAVPVALPPAGAPMLPAGAPLPAAVPHISSLVLTVGGDDDSDSATEEQQNKSRRTAKTVNASGNVDGKEKPMSKKAVEDELQALRQDLTRSNNKVEELERELRLIKAGPPGGSQSFSSPAFSFGVPVSASAPAPAMPPSPEPPMPDLKPQAFSTTVAEATGIINALMFHTTLPGQPNFLAERIVSSYPTLRELQQSLIYATPETYVWTQPLTGKTGNKQSNIRAEEGTLVGKILADIRVQRSAFFATSLPAVLLNKSTKHMIKTVQSKLREHQQVRGKPKAIDAASIAKDRLANYTEKADLGLYMLPSYNETNGEYVALDTLPADTATYQSLTGRQKAGTKGAVTRRNRDYAILKELVNLTDQLRVLKQGYAQSIGACCEQECMRKALENIFHTKGQMDGLNFQIKSLLQSMLSGAQAVDGAGSGGAGGDDDDAFSTTAL